jgi:CBS domain-containing protein
MDDKGRVSGLLDSLDLLRADIGKSRMSRGEETGEKTRLRSAGVRGFMKKDFPRASPDTQIRDVIRLMSRSRIPTAIVEQGGKMAGIITPKPILRLFSREKAFANIRISGIGEEDQFIKSIVYKNAEKRVSRIAEMIPVKYAVIGIESHHKAGTRKKYSVKARLITFRGLFFADDHAWDLTKAVSGTLAKLEREVSKKLGKQRVRSRGT